MYHKLKKLIRKLLTAACLVLATGTAMAQNGNVSLSSQQMKAKAAFDEITEQSGYMFAYNHTTFDNSRTVSFANKDISIKEALANILRGTGCTYEMRDRHIVIVPGPIQTESSARTVPRPYQDYFITQTIVPGTQAPPRIETKTTKRIVGREYIDSPTDTLYTYPQITNVIRNTFTSARSSKYILDTPPVLALKTNLLYAGATFTPNLALEIGLGKKTSLDLMGSYNPWNLDGSEGDNKKLVHWVVRPEFRYWLCERFNGHFFGVHAFYSNYNVSGYNVPLLFEKDYRYEGNAYGAGISYGYHWMLAKRWGLEFNIGAGVALMKYDKFDCEKCGDKLGTYDKTYIGPTSVGIKLIFIID